jgi:hypothetical protein
MSENLMNQVEEKKNNKIDELTQSRRDFMNSTGFKFSSDVKKLMGKNTKLDFRRGLAKY